MKDSSDPYRPQYHFVPETGWINDPNGLVHFRDQWHLFYQYFNPAELDGMQWGHAVSRDLMHWEHLPPAIRPDAHGQIWSGSAIVDHHDASGLFGGKAGIICLFTYWDKSDGRQCQGMAYSADGVSFTTYEHNPVIPQLRHLPGHTDDKEFRDPKVFRHEPSGRWVMVVAGGRLRLFSSTDLIHWTFESLSDTIDTECPDLFELPVDGNPADTRWVLSLGGRKYILGDFDGKRFTPSGGPLVMSGGPDFYASQSWSDAPGNRRIIISWLFGWGYGCKPDAGRITNVFPTKPRSGGCLSVPYELSLVSEKSGVRLCMQPIPELDRLHSVQLEEKNIPVSDDTPRHIHAITNAFDISFNISRCSAKRVGVRIPAGQAEWYDVGYDHERKCLFVDRRKSGAGYAKNFADVYFGEALIGDSLPGLRILIDNCSVEVFTADGLNHMSAFILAGFDAKGFDLFCEGGDAQVGELTVNKMR